MQVFWESHDPTQEMRQGNDVGSHYRTAAYATQPDQLPVIEATRAAFQEQLDAKNFGKITTEVKQIDFERDFYYAEPYHQQYLSKNPNGYCGIARDGRQLSDRTGRLTLPPRSTPITPVSPGR